MIITAVILAVAAAFCLALGTHLQQYAVATLAPGRRRRATWVTGLGLMGLVTVLNVAALGLGPVAIVQPLGAISLIVAALISRRFFGLRLEAPLLISIAVTLFGVIAFVATSARYSHELVTSAASVSRLLAVLVALSVFAVLFAVSRAGHLPRVVMTGVIFGTVAAATHVLARAIVTAGVPGLDPFSARWWMVLTAVALASAVGFWLVQTAYARGPAETVLAGLTVIDPIVAVVIGAAFFGEYSGLTPAAIGLLLLASAGGVGGVWMLSRFHPRVLEAQSPRDGTSLTVATPLDGAPHSARTLTHNSQGART